jgi:hypothetical protein
MVRMYERKINIQSLTEENMQRALEEVNSNGKLYVFNLRRILSLCFRCKMKWVLRNTEYLFVLHNFDLLRIFISDIECCQ